MTPKGGELSCKTPSNCPSCRYPLRRTRSHAVDASAIVRHPTIATSAITQASWTPAAMTRTPVLNVKSMTRARMEVASTRGKRRACRFTPTL